MINKSLNISSRQEKSSNEHEKNISDQLHEHFEEEIFFYISIPVMHRILSLYSTNHQEYISDETNRHRIIDFLYKYVEKRGPDSTILFNIFDIIKDEYFEERMITKFKYNEYNINSTEIISLIYDLRLKFEKEEEITRNQIIQIQENTNEVSENNENSSELEKCLIAKINEFLIVGKAVEAQKRATCPIT